MIFRRPKPRPSDPCPRCGSTAYRVHFCAHCGLQTASTCTVEQWLRRQRDLVEERELLRLALSRLDAREMYDASAADLEPR